MIPAKPPLELADISENVVDKYSLIRVDNGFYSVPDYLVGYTLTVKTYPDEVIAYSGFNEVCRHKRLHADERYSVDIFHYLDTLARKPGAVRNSVALRSKTRLKEAFDEHYADHPKDFIVELERLRGLPIDEIADILTSSDRRTKRYLAPGGDSLDANILRNTRNQLAAISAAFLKGGEKVAC